MQNRRRAATRDIVLGSIAAVLLGLAIFVMTQYGGGERAAPTDESSWTHYQCEACAEFFHLNGREIERAMTTAGERSTTSDGRSIIFRCKKCGELAAVRASKCPEHGDVIKLSPGPDDPNQCSQCDFRFGR